jgi:hypothetical protein
MLFSFYTEGPETIVFKVYDHDDVGKNDFLGECQFDTRPIFAKPGASSPTGEMFTGVSKLQKVKKGSIGFDITCRTMTPVKTEKLLAICEQQLKEAQAEVEKNVAIANNLKAQIEGLRKDIEDGKVAHAFELEGLRKQLDESKTAHAAAIADAEGAKKSIAERDSKLVFIESKLAESQKEVGAKSSQIETLKKQLHDKEHEEAPIVVDVDAKPFCVCFGTKCSIM